MQTKPTKTFTAPKGYITIGKEKAGFIRSLSFTENIGRSNVQGIGSMVIQEAPATSINCQFTIDQYFLDFSEPVMKEMLNRYGGAQKLLNTLALGEITFNIIIYRREIVGDIVDNLVQNVNDTGSTLVVLSGCMITSQNFSLSEAGIAGYNISGIYLTPSVTNP